MRRLMGSLVASMAFGAVAACGQDASYDGLRAGDEAHRLGEEQRQQRLSDQLYLNDAMRARHGWAPSGSVVWYGNAGYGPPVGIDYAYAYSSNRLFGRSRGLYIERYWSPPLSVFEPWPYVPGDIYGYCFPPYVRQPIGQRQIQTAPNRWESHPVYPDEVIPAEDALGEAVIEPKAGVAPIAPEIEAPPPAPPAGDEGEFEPPIKMKPRRYYF